MFYELLAGRKAFPAGGTLAELFARIQNGPPTPLKELCPDLQPEVERIVYRALEKDPDRRYQDLSRMKREIERIRMRIDLEAGPLEGEDETEIRRGPRPPGSRELVQRAEAAFAAGDDAEAIKLCNEALRIDRELKAATDFLGKARDRRTQRQVDQWLSEARQLIARGDLTGAESRVTQAMSVLPASVQAAELARVIQEARQRAIAEREQAQRLDDLLAAGRRALDAGEYDRALEAAHEMERLEPGHADAGALRGAAARGIEEQRGRALDARVTEVLARAEIESGAGRWPQAIGLLEGFSPEHPRVSARLGELRGILRGIVERRAQAGSLIGQARAAHDAGDFHKAVALLNEADALQPDDPDAARLRAACVAAIERAEREAQQLRQVEQHVRAAQQLEQAGRLADALQEVRRALGVRGDHAAARALEQRIGEGIAAEQRAAEERRVDDLIQTARAEFGQRRYPDAFARLSTIAAAHPRAAAAAEQLRAELQALETKTAEAMAAAAAALEAGRFADGLALLAEAEEAFPDRAEIRTLQQTLRQGLDEDARVETLCADAERALERGQLDRARAAVDGALRLRPTLARAVGLRDCVEQALEQARLDAIDWRAHEAVDNARRQFAARAHEQALRGLEQFDPPHLVVAAELERLKGEYEDLRRRAEAVAAAGREALERQQHEQAGVRLAELEALLPNYAALADSKTRLQDAVARRAKVERLLDQAEVELRKPRFDRASAAVAQALELDGDYPPAAALAQKIGGAVEARDRAELERRLSTALQNAAALAANSASRKPSRSSRPSSPHGPKSPRSSSCCARQPGSAPKRTRSGRPSVPRDGSRARPAWRPPRESRWSSGQVGGSGSRAASRRHGRRVRRRRRSAGAGSKGEPDPARAGPAAPPASVVVAPLPVSIDAVPWARVRISTTTTGATVPPEALETPVSLALPPGTYTLEFENGGLSRPMTQQIVVEAGKANSFPFRMPDFNIEAVISELVGPERE